VADPDLLPPELLDGLRDLDWIARILARGTSAGIHRSPFSGMGEEFDRHRPYQQGDELRHLDWRLLARSDRMHVRRYRESTNLRALVVLDATPSMDFAAGGGITKLRYGVLLAAALGHLLHRMGDLPGLAVLDGRGSGTTVRPHAGKEARDRFLHALERVAPGPPAPLAPLLERAVDLLPPGGRVIVLSDFLEDDDGEAVARAAGSLRARGDEVRAVRILTPVELGEREGGDALYEDPERPGLRVPAAPGEDPGYRERLDAYYRALARSFEERGVIWHEVSTAEPLLAVLRRWVAGERAGPP
jgi:uncharacterized protein (DUF58 family)